MTIQDLSDASMTTSGLGAFLTMDPTVLEAVPAAIYICAANGVILRYNRRAAELWGRSPRIGDTDQLFCGSFKLYEMSGAHLPHDRTPMAVVLQTGERRRDQEVVIERPDGSRITVLVNIDPLKDGGRVVGAINCFQDISERRRAESSLAGRMEEQSALFQLADRLHRAETLEDVYGSSLDSIQKALACQRASILLFDDAGVMRFVAWRGLSDTYRAATDGHSPWTPDARDPKPICVDDVGDSDIEEPLRTTVESAGIGALAFIPLMAKGRLVGKFMAYYDAPHRFSDPEMDLAVTIGRQLGFGIEKIRAERELRESLARERDQADELRAIMEAVPAVIWIARDPECRVIQGNSASQEFLRLRHDANPSMSAPEDQRPNNFMVYHEDRRLSPEELPVQRAARGEEVRDFEHETRFDDGTTRFLLGNARPLRNALGEPSGSVAAFVDITERKKAEQQRDLLIAELNHRVKNTLATVISIANQSFTGGQSLEEARQSFGARIRALGQTHSRLAETNWSGVLLEALLDDEFAPYRRDDGGNVRFSGPPVSLNPRCALTLGLTVHELTTNAAKYGALSSQSGTVEVVWRVLADSRSTLKVHWAENGGPKVSPPERSGFGRLLMERVLSTDLGGEVRLDFARDGLRCDIDIPLDTNAAEPV